MRKTLYFICLLSGCTTVIVPSNLVQIDQLDSGVDSGTDSMVMENDAGLDNNNADYHFRGFGSYTTALYTCASNRETMPIILNSQDNDIFLNHLDRFEVQGAWVGMDRLNYDNAYRWVSGEPATYQRWQEQNPSYGPEQCVAVGHDGWNDIICPSIQAIVCRAM